MIHVCDPVTGRCVVCDKGRSKSSVKLPHRKAKQPHKLVRMTGDLVWLDRRQRENQRRHKLAKLRQKSALEISFCHEKDQVVMDPDNFRQLDKIRKNKKSKLLYLTDLPSFRDTDRSSSFSRHIPPTLFPHKPDSILVHNPISYNPHSSTGRSYGDLDYDSENERETKMYYLFNRSPRVNLPHYDGTVTSDYSYQSWRNKREVNEIPNFQKERKNELKQVERLEKIEKLILAKVNKQQHESSDESDDVSVEEVVKEPKVEEKKQSYIEAEEKTNNVRVRKKSEKPIKPVKKELKGNTTKLSDGNKKSSVCTIL